MDVYENGTQKYVRTNEEHVTGIPYDETTDHIYLFYSTGKQLSVRYQVLDSTGAEIVGGDDYEPKLVGPTDILSNEELHFTLQLGPRCTLNSVTFNGTRLTAAKNTGTNYEYTVDTSRLSSLSGEVTVTATVTRKTGYTVSFAKEDVSNTAVSDVASVSDPLKWTPSTTSGTVNTISRTFTSGAGENCTFYVHGANRWDGSGVAKTLSKLAVVSIGDDSVFKMLVIGGQTKLIHDITVTVTPSADTELTLDGKLCTTPMYTVTVENCYEDIVFSCNFKNNDKEVWVEQANHIEWIDYGKGNMAPDEIKDKIANKDGNSTDSKKKQMPISGNISVTVKPEAGYYLSNSSAGVYQNPSHDIPANETTTTTSWSGKQTTSTVNNWAWTLSSGGTGTLTLYTPSSRGYLYWGIRFTAEPYKYRVRYKLTSDVSNISAFEEKDYLYTDTISVPGTRPTRSGYIFTGWTVKGLTGSVSPGSSFAVADLSGLSAESVDVIPVEFSPNWKLDNDEAKDIEIHVRVTITVVDMDGNWNTYPDYDEGVPRGLPLTIIRALVRDMIGTDVDSDNYTVEGWLEDEKVEDALRYERVGDGNHIKVTFTEKEPDYPGLNFTVTGGTWVYDGKEHTGKVDWYFETEGNQEIGNGYIMNFHGAQVDDAFSMEPAITNVGKLTFTVDKDTWAIYRNDYNRSNRFTEGAQYNGEKDSAEATLEVTPRKLEITASGAVDDTRAYPGDDSTQWKEIIIRDASGTEAPFPITLGTIKDHTGETVTITLGDGEKLVLKVVNSAKPGEEVTVQCEPLWDDAGTTARKGNYEISFGDLGTLKVGAEPPPTPAAKITAKIEENNTDTDGNRVALDGIEYKWSTDTAREGTGTTISDLHSGDTLTVTETLKAEDYEVVVTTVIVQIGDEAPKEYTVEPSPADGKQRTITVNVPEGITADTEINITFHNERQETAFVLLRKVDGHTGTPLSGAEFTLENKATGMNQTLSSDGGDAWENGVLFAGELAYGEYTLTETKAPDGYRGKSWKFTVNENGLRNLTEIP